MTHSGLTRLTSVFADSLGLSESEVSGAQYRVTIGWDSVAHMSLVAALEGEFEIMLETDDVIALSSFEKAQEILARYGVGF